MDGEMDVFDRARLVLAAAFVGGGIAGVLFGHPAEWAGAGVGVAVLAGCAMGRLSRR